MIKLLSKVEKHFFGFNQFRGQLQKMIIVSNSASPILKREKGFFLNCLIPFPRNVASSVSIITCRKKGGGKILRTVNYYLHTINDHEIEYHKSKKKKIRKLSQK